MTNDEQRISYLSLGASEGIDAAEQAELDELNALLADSSLWDEPPSDLADRVVAAVAADRAGSDRAGSDRVGSHRVGSHRAGGDRAGPSDDAVVDLGSVRRRRTGWLGPFVAGVAVAAAVAMGVVALGSRAGGGDAVVLALAGTELAPPGVSGTARVTETESGLRIELDASGLPRREGREFYQAWLKGDAGLVPIGTFHTGDNVVLWAGVALADFPTLTVTLEEVGDQESSGQKVLIGKVAGP
jgi:hypothetical protein